MSGLSSTSRILVGGEFKWGVSAANAVRVCRTAYACSSRTPVTRTRDFSEASAAEVPQEPLLPVERGRQHRDRHTELRPLEEHDDPRREFDVHPAPADEPDDPA